MTRKILPKAQGMRVRKVRILTEVAWRVAVMRTQVSAKGAALFLTARAFPWTLEDAQAAVNRRIQPRCLSCGDPVTEVRRPRCTPCGRAAIIVMNEVREGAQSA